MISLGWRSLSPLAQITTNPTRVWAGLGAQQQAPHFKWTASFSKPLCHLTRLSPWDQSLILTTKPGKNDQEDSRRGIKGSQLGRVLFPIQPFAGRTCPLLGFYSFTCKMKTCITGFQCPLRIWNLAQDPKGYLVQQNVWQINPSAGRTHRLGPGTNMAWGKSKSPTKDTPCLSNRYSPLVQLDESGCEVLGGLGHRVWGGAFLD